MPVPPIAVMLALSLLARGLDSPAPWERGPDGFLPEPARLELSVDCSRVYHHQPFTLELTILVNPLPAPFGERDPLSVPGVEPALHIPWLQVPRGLQGDDPVEWLRPLHDLNGYGFRIDEMTCDFDPATFRPLPDRGDPVQVRYRFRRRFVTGRSGQYTFAGVTLAGAFCTGVRRIRNRAAGESHAFTLTRTRVTSDPVSVTVVDPPSGTRPPFFTGGCGRFRISARVLSTARLKVYDPFTVEITVTGPHGLEDVGPLTLVDQPEIARRFKVFADTPAGTIQGRDKVFLHELRPLGTEVTELPAIAFSYFDVEQGAYRTLHTEPVPLPVAPARLLKPGDVVVDPESAGSTDLTERPEGLFANVTDEKRLGNEQVRPDLWFGLLASLVCLFALLAFVVTAVRRRQARRAARRCRDVFTRGLKTIRAARRAGDPVAAIQSALTAAVAAVREVPADSVTPRDAAVLENAFGDAELARGVEGLLERCAAVRFGTTGLDPDDLARMVDRAETLMTALVRIRRCR